MVAMRVSKKAIHCSLLGCFIVVALSFGPGKILLHELSHSHPTGYFASDAFWLASYAQSIVDLGHYREYAPYLDGGLPGVVANNPPILYHLAAMLHQTSILPLYDSILLIVLMFSLVSLLILYQTIRLVSERASLIMLPLFLYLYTQNFSTMFTWGIWTFSLSSAFTFLFLFCWYREKLAFRIPLLTVSLAACFMTYSPSVVFLIMFIALQMLLKLVFRSLSIKEVKEIMIAGVLSMILAGYYLFVFFNTLYPTQKFHFHVLRAAEYGGIAVAQFSHLGWWGWLGVAGFLLMLFMIQSVHRSPFFIGMMFFLFGFSNLIGFEKRGLYMRFLWPVFIAVGCAYLLALIINLLPKYRNILTYAVGIAAAIFIVVSNTQPASAGMMDQQRWDSLKWIKDNTDSNAKVLFIGEYYSQEGTISLANRVAYRLIYQQEVIIQELQQGSLFPAHHVSSLRENLAGVPYKKSAFAFGYYAYAEDQRKFFARNESFRNFNYIVVDRLTSNQGIAQYHQLIIDNIGFQPVFNNQIAVILENQGEIDEQRFPQ
jgi:hypothetical protein